LFRIFTRAQQPLAARLAFALAGRFAFADRLTRRLAAGIATGIQQRIHAAANTVEQRIQAIAEAVDKAVHAGAKIQPATAAATI
jgi:hypothetical protein